MKITEALAELKTIKKRIEKKREFINGYLYRQERIKDPLEKDTPGGSRQAIANELQSINDLEERYLAVKRAIQKANDATMLTINDRFMSISDWLIWRRDLASDIKTHHNTMRSAIAQIRREAQQKGMNVVTSGSETKSDLDIVVNINEQKLAKDIETMELILGGLDGQLSLMNATVMVEV